jgi:hypothetical protein
MGRRSCAACCWTEGGLIKIELFAQSEASLPSIGSLNEKTHRKVTWNHQQCGAHQVGGEGKMFFPRENERKNCGQKKVKFSHFRSLTHRLEIVSASKSSQARDLKITARRHQQQPRVLCRFAALSALRALTAHRH